MSETHADFPRDRWCQQRNIRAAIQQTRAQTGKAVGALDIDLQAGTPLDELEQISADPAKVAVTIKECKRCLIVIDHEPRDRMQLKPTCFAGCQVNAFGRQRPAAARPALGNFGNLRITQRLEGRIDQTQQLVVAPVQGKAETAGLGFDERVQPHIVEVVEVDQVIARHRIAEKQVDLAKSQRSQCQLVRWKKHEFGVGV